jgi:hypothetical protein
MPLKSCPICSKEYSDSRSDCPRCHKITCRDCRAPFKTSLQECPECGWIRKSNWRLYPVFVLIAAVFLGVYFICVYGNSFDEILPRETLINVTQDKSSSELRDNWAKVGDFFGGILSPIFAFLGLILLVVTLRLNLKELALSRSELALTREEVAKSSDALEEQAKSLEAQSESLQRQNFESTFFHLMELFGQSTQKVLFMNSQGRKGFRLKANDWKYYIKMNKKLMSLYGLNDDNIKAIKSQLEDCNATLEKSEPWELEHSGLLSNQKYFLNELEEITTTNSEEELLRDKFERTINNSTLDHYLSSLESLLSYISGAQVGGKVFYNDLIRAQISSDVIYIIYFALIVKDDFTELKKLCTEASLFKKLTVVDFHYGENHMRYYEKKAFGLSGEWN